MNNKTLVTISNTIGICSILLLVYWVFTFSLIEIFGLKVFRENLTESFYLSILGILALMMGALIMNIMFNLTRIAEKDKIEEQKKSTPKKLIWLLLALFPIIGILLFAGDYLTSKKKEKILVNSAQSIVQLHEERSNKLVDYQFSKEYIKRTSETLELYNQVDKDISHVTLIAQDTIEDTPYFLAFDANYNVNDTLSPRKVDYIRKSTSIEREYLQGVFDNEDTDYWYSSHDGNYELYYPLKKGDKTIVLYFSQYQRYGKIGS